MKQRNLIILLTFISYYSFGQFSNDYKTILGCSAPVEHFISADINSDAYNDIIYSSGRYLLIQKNLENNGFTSPIPIYFGDYDLELLDVKDIDGDGDLDIFAQDDYTGIFWIEYIDSLDKFDENIHLIHSETNIIEVQAVDLDTDGDFDIVFSSTNNYRIVWLENDNGIFSDTATIVNFPYNSDNTSKMFFRDIDNDNDIDIIWQANNNTPSYSKIYLYEDTSGVSDFNSEVEIISTASRSIQVEDIDNDNDLDIVQLNNNDSLCWYENIGNSFSMHLIEDSLDYDLFDFKLAKLGDNNDIDLLAFKQSSSYGWMVCYKDIFYNLSDSVDTIFTIYSQNTIDIDFKIYDIDNDNDNDLLYSHNVNETSSKDLFCRKDTNSQANFGNEEIISSINYSLSHSYNSIFPGDVDSDGNIDVFGFNEEKLIWAEKLAANEFGQIKTVSSIVDYNDFNPFSIKFGDVNDNGKLNALAINSLGDIKCYYNTSDTLKFDSIVYLTINSSVKALDICDLDNDQDLDILYYSGKFKWIENDGNGSFFYTDHIISDDLILTSGNLFAGDIDGDNDNDFISPTDNYGEISWYENIDGLGNFGPKHVLADTIENSVLMGLFDFDNDSDLDVLILIDDNSLVWNENIDGLGDFNEIHIIFNTNNISHYTSKSVEDIDNDGDLDILLLYTSNTYNQKISWFENDGTGNFTEHNIIENEETSTFYLYSNCKLIDIDSDGDYDLIYNRSNEGDMLLLENYTISTENRIEGTCFFDINENGILDTLEKGIQSSITHLDPIGISSYTNNNGVFWHAVGLGNYTLTYEPIPNWHLTSNPEEYNVIITSINQTVDSLNFGFYPDSFFTAINPSITASNNLCGENFNIWLNYQNIGTTIPNGIIELILDDQITFVSSINNIDSINGQHLYWHFDSLQYFDSDMIQITALRPDISNIGDTLISSLIIYTEDSIGQNSFSDLLIDHLECSYDPNDKLSRPKNNLADNYVSLNDTIEYTVRFQNTGNSEAVNVKIIDQIDENLDIQSIQIIASSHNMQTFIDQNRQIIFQFDSIMLPDSASNFIESQGFVKYSAIVIDSVLPNTSILNTANIYFDNNSAIQTNTVENIVECYLSPMAPDITQEGNILQVETDYDVQWLLNGIEILNETDTFYVIEEDGDYSVIVTDENGCSTESDIYTITNTNINNINKDIVKIYPNPTIGKLKIESVKRIEQIEITDINGRIVKQLVVDNEQCSVDLNKEKKGIYFVKVIFENGVYTQKIVLT